MLYLFFIIFIFFDYYNINIFFGENSLLVKIPFFWNFPFGENSRILIKYGWSNINQKGIETIIQCNENDKKKKFIVKIENNKSKIYFYNWNKIKEELSFTEQANEIDNQRKKMNIIIYDNNENNNSGRKAIKLKDNICPNCEENIFRSISKIKDIK